MTPQSTDETVDDSTEEPILHAENLAVSHGTVRAIDGIDLSILPGAIVGVIGPNGAGKTTLADTIAGFHGYEGTLTYAGREIRTQSTAALVEAGLVYCTEERDLFGYMSVADNLRMGAYRRGRGNVAEQLSRVYDLFPVLEERVDQNARTLSGGEQQMLAIGRALMGRPETLLLDEPTLGLAPIVLDDISEALEEITEAGVTVVLCEQNVTFTMRHADTVYLLENGAIAESGQPSELRGNEYVQDVYLGG